jgi:hypothetical protein
VFGADADTKTIALGGGIVTIAIIAGIVFIRRKFFGRG